MRLQFEDKYLSVKMAAYQGISPRIAWERYVKPLVLTGGGEHRHSLRWEIRALQEFSSNVTELIELTYRRGIPWVEENTANGREWIVALNRVAVAQIDAALKERPRSD